MKHLLTPKLDLVFKLLFAENTEILIDLINAVLALPESQRIQTIEVKNPTILPEEIHEKYIVLDIHAIDCRHHEYDIEMQAQKYPFYPERAMFYLSRLYSKQLDSGEKYEQLKPVVGIHFLNYEQFPGYDEFQFHFELKDIRYPELRFTDDFSIHVFELPKFDRLTPQAQWGEKLREWLHFFNHAHEEADNTMRTQYTNPVISKAFNALEKLSDDEKNRRLAQMREDALRNKLSELFAAKEEGWEAGLQKGREEGRKEGREEGRQVGKQEGKQEGIDIGASIGKIQLLQQMLKRSISSKEELMTKDMAELQALLQEMEQCLMS